jgi:uncharacterized protein (TIGR03437 family)
MRFTPLLLALSAVQAQPIITPKGIANSASFLPAGLPGGAVARGSTFTLFGSGLGPTAAAQQPSYPLQITLAGVSIKVTQGSTVVNAIPTYVSDAAINAIMPSNAPLGLVSVKVTYNGKASNPQTVRVVSNNPGLFSATGFGYGPGAIYNFSNTGAQVNSPLHPAQPGQTIALFGNGLGPITQADTDTPPVANLPFKAELFIGGVAVTDFAYVGRLPGVAGIDQINFQLPANAPQGCYVPVTLRIASTAVSNTVTMAITSTGAACTDSFNPLALAPIKGGTAGAVALIREVRTEDVQVSTPLTVTGDYAMGLFARFPASDFGFHSLTALPPPGTCTTYGVTNGVGDTLAHSAFTNLSAGPISASGSGGTIKFQSVTEGDRFDFALLGLDTPLPGVSPLPLFLNPGKVTVSAGGSGDIGAFSVDLNVGSPPVWTNRDQLSTIDTKQPLTVNWTGATQVVIVGRSRDYPTNSEGNFICTAPPGASSFTIPSYILATLPLTRAKLTNSTGFIALHSIGPVQQFNPGNLSFGAALVDFVNERSAIFK